MKTITIECRQINEWDDATRAQIIERHRDINVDIHDWWDAVYEHFHRVAAILGVEPRDINFSGFWSQGDGARFNGRYDWKEDAPEQIRNYAPQDAELHRIADELAAFPGAWATIEYRYPIYEHEYMTEINVDLGEDTEYDKASDQAIQELLRDLMRWLYRQLEKEYEYLTSDEAVRETLAINEYEFDADGRIW